MKFFDTVFDEATAVTRLAEGRYEGERTLSEHGATPMRYLDRLGVLGPRTIGVGSFGTGGVASVIASVIPRERAALIVEAP